MKTKTKRMYTRKISNQIGEVIDYAPKTGSNEQQGAD